MASWPRCAAPVPCGRPCPRSTTSRRRWAGWPSCTRFVSSWRASPASTAPAPEPPPSCRPHPAPGEPAVIGSRPRPLDLGTPLATGFSRGLTSGPTTGLATGLTTGLATGVTTGLATVLLRRWPPGGAAPGGRPGGGAGGVPRGRARVLRGGGPRGGAAGWRRGNPRGEPVTLLEGPALVLGATAGLLAAPCVPPRVRAGAVAAVLGAGALGAYDDLAGDGRRKGLAGHLGALARGEVTTGAVKLLGLAATGVVAAVATGTPATGPATAGRSTASGVRWLADVAVGGAVVAGSANLLNLLDLRPGRALKAALLGAVPLLAGGSRSAVPAGARSAGPAAAAGAAPAAAAALAAAAAPGAAAVGAAAVLLPADLGERTMLGDCGANAAGALLGVAALGRLGLRGRTTLLLALVALTAASERISFTRVIESTPVLRELDRLGRRPPAGVESR